ncbi:MAG TPA: SpoIVB peptidase [Candidatus Eisenbergiella intestinipullorum]|nr:SpoIVB peptidase [Candidatus Eisenbergiella intestinipullorum]
MQNNTKLAETDSSHTRKDVHADVCPFQVFGKGCEELERRRKYRLILCLILICAVAALFICWMFLLWNRVPGMIHIRAGVQQELDLNVPASGEVYRNEEAGEKKEDGYKEEAVAAVGRSVTGSTSSESLPVDLSRPLTLYAQELESYTMQLKLFGLIPFKTVQVEVIDDRTLIPAGIPIGIYVKTKGVLVIATGEFEGPEGQMNAPAARLLKEGDYILKANGEEVTGKAEFMQRIADSEGKQMLLTIQRDGQQFDVSLQPEQNQNGEYKLGIWIRDNAQGVGTLTWLDEDNSFGALGHGINDVDTAELMDLESGSLYQTQIVAIRRGENGAPGELTGVIDYGESNRIGTIEANTEEGIYGSLDEEATDGIISSAIPVGLKQEVAEGEAEILCSVGGEPELYTIEITGIHLDHDNVNRGLEITVTDERLLALTGGIVQGMSGAPIIQDGKLIGAVTHVLVNDPTKGYGIFIENMLGH